MSFMPLILLFAGFRLVLLLSVPLVMPKAGSALIVLTTLGGRACDICAPGYVGTVPNCQGEPALFCFFSKSLSTPFLSRRTCFLQPVPAEPIRLATLASVCQISRIVPLYCL